MIQRESQRERWGHIIQLYPAALFAVVLSVYTHLQPLPSAGSPSGPSVSGPEAAAERRVARIDLRDERLSVRLHAVPWAVVLLELQRQTGVTFRVLGALEGAVTEAFDALPFERGLRRLLRHTNCIFLYEALQAGGRLSEVWILPRGERNPAEVARAPQQPVLEAADALSILIKSALTGERPRERARAIGVLGEYQNPLVRESLIQALQDSDARVRERAVDVLIDFQDEAIVDHLGLVLLEDTDEHVRESAAEALWQIASPQAIDALREALEDASANVRQIAEEALGKIGGHRANEALGQALHDANEDVRQIDPQALEELQGDDRPP